MALNKALKSNVVRNRIFSSHQAIDFSSLALDIFKEQYENVAVYRKFCDLLRRNPENVKSLNSIPFLPISAFKNERVLPKNSDAKRVFKSSGTENSLQRSCHYIVDESIYHKSLKIGFEHFLGPIDQYIMVSLLPGYAENPESSLIHMVDELSKFSKDAKLHSFHKKPENLVDFLEQIKTSNSSVILFGVSFALIDLAEKYNLNLSNVIIIETGGMKGRRKEITRAELHSTLSDRLNPLKIVSEYGMTELLSQAYAINGTEFICPPWMKVFVRETQDPLSINQSGSGALNIIDLANIYSCSFIATDDLGVLNENGSFEVLGRFDHSDIRGCSLLVQ